MDKKAGIFIRLPNELKEEIRRYIIEEYGRLINGLIGPTIEKFIREGLERRTHAHKTTILRETKNVPPSHSQKEVKPEVMEPEAANAIVLSNNGDSITTDLADSYLDKIEAAKHRKHMVKISMLLAYLRKENKIGLIEGNDDLVYKMDFVKAMKYVYPRCTDDRTASNQLNILLTDKEIEVVPGKGLAVYRIIHISEITE
jgi:hypothetical protein